MPRTLAVIDRRNKRGEGGVELTLAGIKKQWQAERYASEQRSDTTGKRGYGDRAPSPQLLELYGRIE
jgi:hypothetical protein